MTVTNLDVQLDKIRLILDNITDDDVVAETNLDDGTLLLADLDHSIEVVPSPHPNHTTLLVHDTRSGEEINRLHSDDTENWILAHALYGCFQRLRDR